MTTDQPAITSTVLFFSDLLLEARAEREALQGRVDEALALLAYFEIRGWTGYAERDLARDVVRALARPTKETR